MAGKVPEGQDYADAEAELDRASNMDEGDEVEESLLDSPTSLRGQRVQHHTTQEGPVTATDQRSNSLSRKTSELGEVLGRARLSTTVDDVFKPPPVNPPPNASGSSIGSSGPASNAGEPRLPPAYNIIRAAKNKTMAAIRVGATFGIGRSQAPIKSGYRGGLVASGDMRSFRAQNFHSTEKGLNLSFSVARPDSGVSDSLGCLACDTDHSLAEKMKEKGLPVLIILSDQNFPAILPMLDGLCPIVIRVEDGTMADLAGVFLERFSAYTSPHGALSPGSVVLMGSLTHLLSKGLADYTDNFVSAAFRLGGRVGQSVEILPLVPIPLHGIDSTDDIRTLLDLDAWIAAVSQPVGSTLPGARSAFWKIVMSNPCCVKQSHVTTVMLPAGIKNNRKVSFSLDPPLDPLPASLPPFGAIEEKEVISKMIIDINGSYGLGLDEDPDLGRDHDPGLTTSKGRLITVGASHARRVAKELAYNHSNTIDLSIPGWIPSKTTVEKMVENWNTSLLVSMTLC